jgi:hemoglobin
LACAVVLLMASAAEAQTQTQTQTQTQAAPKGSLYQRIGGYDTIAAMVDDVFARMGADQQVQRFFVGLSDSTMRRTRQLSVDFICEKSGGPCFYTGRSMVEAHKGMGITAADWDRVGVLMGETLDKLGVQGELREEIGGFISSLRGDIVGQQ